MYLIFALILVVYEFFQVCFICQQDCDKT